jgi:serine phosphatase RsbU (regulator of sigma subunit)
LSALIKLPGGNVDGEAPVSVPATPPATLGLARTIVGRLLGLDLVFKLIIGLALFESFGVDGAADRKRAVLLMGGLAIPLVAGWVVALLVPCRRIEMGGNDPSALQVAAETAYRLPLRGACVWAAHWVLLSGLTLILLDRGWPVTVTMPPLSPAAWLLFELTMLGGALALAFSLLAFSLGPVAGALSVAARARKLELRVREVSLRQQLVGMAFALSLTPLLWMGTMAYMAHRRMGPGPAPASGTGDGFFFTFSLYLVGVGLWGPICAWLFGRAVTGPIDRVAAALDEVARAGRAADVARVPVYQKDEVGRLADHANAMIDVLEATGRDLEQATRELEQRERVARELEIGARIQASILPRRLVLRGAELSARMIPATEVGGDYFDVLPAADGGWIAIGDVSGHGLPAGMIMMMAQSAVAALVQRQPAAQPGEILGALNAVLYENIRQRMGADEYLTLTLLRYYVDGRVLFAGAHEDLLVCRASSTRCERIATQGAWMGVMRDATSGLPQATLVLTPGDLLVLYTDGITEARDAAGGQFGADRLVTSIETARARATGEIVASVFTEVRAWQSKPDDDQTLLALRYLGG